MFLLLLISNCFMNKKRKIIYIITSDVFLSLSTFINDDDSLQLGGCFSSKKACEKCAQQMKIFLVGDPLEIRQNFYPHPKSIISGFQNMQMCAAIFERSPQILTKFSHRTLTSHDHAVIMKPGIVIKTFVNRSIKFVKSCR